MNIISNSWTTATTKHRIFTARAIAFLDAVFTTFMFLSIKKATHISGPNILMFRCLSALLVVKLVMDKTGISSWEKSGYDKNTFLARGFIGGMTTFISTLSLKVTDLQIYSVLVASGIPMTVIFSRLAGVPQPKMAYVSSATVFLGIYLVVFEGFAPNLKDSKKGIFPNFLNF